jgi:hypothetical protein
LCFTGELVRLDALLPRVDAGAVEATADQATHSASSAAQTAAPSR